MIDSHRHRLGVYRREADSYLIEIKLREARQLFNTLDPSPFHEKDLDPAAEEYLVGAVRELGARRGKLITRIAGMIIETRPTDAGGREAGESIREWQDASATS